MASKETQKNSSKVQTKVSDVLAESRETLYGGCHTSKEPVTLESVHTLISDMGVSISNKLEQFDSAIKRIDTVCEALSHLSVRVTSLESETGQLNVRLSDFDSNLKGLGNVFDNVNEVCIKNEKKLQKTSDHTRELEDQIRKLQQDFTIFKTEKEKELIDISEKNDHLSEQMTDLRCRSMKYNLIFSGLAEQHHENTEHVIRGFLNDHLEITRNVELANVHRFGKGTGRGPRPIVAKFIYQSDIDMVLRNAKKLRGKHFRINKQFPQEIEQARKSLYPKMKELRESGAKVKMVRDVLYVNGHPYSDDTEIPNELGGNRDNWRSNKRARVGSTPERF